MTAPSNCDPKDANCFCFKADDDDNKVPCNPDDEDCTCEMDSCSNVADSFNFDDGCTCFTKFKKDDDGSDTVILDEESDACNFGDDPCYCSLA